jgi:YhcH/YjgK/YiaL family protein
MEDCPMIVDTLKNAETYTGVGDRLATALKFLSETDFSTVPDGKMEIDGENLFAIAQSYQSRSLEESKWEAHRKYIDVQFIVDGAERIGVANIEKLSPLTEYDADSDCLFLEGVGNLLTLSAGDFAVLHLWDAHMPGVAVDAPAAVRKVVVKIKVDS